MVPIRVHIALIPTQHDESVTNDEIVVDLKQHVIKPVIPEKCLNEKPIFYLNPFLMTATLVFHYATYSNRRYGNKILNGSGNGLVSNDALMRQSPATINTSTTNMYEEISKLSLQRDPSDDTAMKQRLCDNVGQLIDPNHVSLLKSVVVSGQPLGQTLHGAPYA